MNINKDANNHKKKYFSQKCCHVFNETTYFFLPIPGLILSTFSILYLRDYFYFCFCFCGCLEFSFN